MFCEDVAWNRSENWSSWFQTPCLRRLEVMGSTIANVEIGSISPCLFQLGLIWFDLFFKKNCRQIKRFREKNCDLLESVHENAKKCKWTLRKKQANRKCRQWCWISWTKRMLFFFVFILQSKSCKETQSTFKEPPFFLKKSTKNHVSRIIQVHWN